jgi:hypothetical protein
MHFFLDIEASALDGFPVEVAWVGDDGSTESHLIRPEPSWVTWDWRAEALHGLSLEHLRQHGEPGNAVAKAVMKLLTGTVWSDNPAFDAPWLGMLTAVAGLPTVMVLDVRILLRHELSDLPPDVASALVAQADTEARAAAVRAHRASDDAGRLWATVRRARELADIERRR